MAVKDLGKDLANKCMEPVRGQIVCAFVKGNNAMSHVE